MAYKVLYRKYRPQDFNNLYGQDNIKKLLIDSIINDKLAHAYLFAGPRGTGKTSTAKLFAKTINCENAKDGIPCNTCNACLNYEQSPDIIEIDAASNNGVDEIRDLRENAKILPTYSKYKIYIIDEVHMLSQSAWNAFLKILEEPPKHVIFILATTEIQKIPITILSRCQRYNFQKISNDVIKDNIIRISNAENIMITDEAALYLAMLSDGGMRDALSLLDQLSKENIEINVELIEKTFGVLTNNDVNEIFNCMIDNNVNRLEEIFNEYYKKGLDINLLISKLLNYIYELEINSINGNQNNFTIEELKKLASELVTCYNKADALTYLKIVLLSYIKFDKKPQIISREIILEKENQNINQEINDTKSKQENILNTDKIDEKIKIRINNSFYNASKPEKNKFKKSWESFINKETINNNVEILSLIEDINIEVVSPTNVLFSHKSPSTAILFNESSRYLEQEFNKSEKMELKFVCLSEVDWKKEKEQFISNKDKKYNYIEEPTDDSKENVLKSAMSVFNDDIIEVN